MFDSFFLANLLLSDLVLREVFVVVEVSVDKTPRHLSPSTLDSATVDFNDFVKEEEDDDDEGIKDEEV